MNSKISCKKCGALILPSTAEGTGGICMPCHEGSREGIEESLEWYDNWWKTVAREVVCIRSGHGLIYTK